MCENAVKSHMPIFADEFACPDNSVSLVVAPSGSERAKRNLHHMIHNFGLNRESMIVTDSTGTLWDLYAPVLKELGYYVKHLNFQDPASINSAGWNPLVYCRDLYCSGNEAFQTHSLKVLEQLAAALYPMDQNDGFIAGGSQALFFAACLVLFELASREQASFDNVCSLMGSDFWVHKSSKYLGIIAARLPQSHVETEKLRAYISCKNHELKDQIAHHARKGLEAVSRSGPLAAMLSTEELSMSYWDGTWKIAVFIDYQNSDDIQRSLAAITSHFFFSHLTMMASEYAINPEMRWNVVLQDLRGFEKYINLSQICEERRKQNIHIHCFMPQLSVLETRYGTEAAAFIRSYANVLEGEIPFNQVQVAAARSQNSRIATRAPYAYSESVLYAAPINTNGLILKLRHMNASHMECFGAFAIFEPDIIWKLSHPRERTAIAFNRIRHHRNDTYYF